MMKDIAILRDIEVSRFATQSRESARAGCVESRKVYSISR